MRQTIRERFAARGIDPVRLILARFAPARADDYTAMVIAHAADLENLAALRAIWSEWCNLTNSDARP